MTHGTLQMVRAAAVLGLTIALATGLAGSSLADTQTAAKSVSAQDAAGPAGLQGPFADRPLGRLIRSNLRRLAALRDELKLTEEQTRQIGRILRNHKAEIIAAVKQLRDGHRKLDAAVTADRIDEAAIRAAAGELGKAIGDAAVLRAKVRVEIRAVLTDEQKARLEQLRREIRASVDQALAEAEAMTD